MPGSINVKVVMTGARLSDQKDEEGGFLLINISHRASLLTTVEMSWRRRGVIAPRSPGAYVLRILHKDVVNIYV